jgi:Zn-finger nucleic acid-binding protein
MNIGDIVEFRRIPIGGRYEIIEDGPNNGFIFERTTPADPMGTLPVSRRIVNGKRGEQEWTTHYDAKVKVVELPAPGFSRCAHGTDDPATWFSCLRPAGAAAVSEVASLPLLEHLTTPHRSSPMELVDPGGGYDGAALKKAIEADLKRFRERYAKPIEQDPPAAPIPAPCGHAAQSPCPKCGGKMQEHYIHEVAELMYCEKCGAVFIDGPDERTEMAAVAEKRICKFCGDIREPEIDHTDCCDRKITGYDENNGPVYFARCFQCGARGPVTSWAADAVGLFYGVIHPLKQDNGDPK